MSTFRSGISAVTKEQALLAYRDSFYGLSGLSLFSSEEGLSLADDSHPVIIMGETGTGKDIAAKLLYAESKASEAPLYIVNCAILDEANWRFLSENDLSLFTDSGNTVYIANVNALSEERRKLLLSLICDTNLHIRNHLLLSFGLRRDAGTPHAAIEYANMLGCLLLSLKPLRDETALLPAAIERALFALAEKSGTRFGCIKTEAMSLLLSYEWKYNHTQLSRVLRTALFRAGNAVIDAGLIERLLRQEAVFTGEISKAMPPSEGSAGTAFPPVFSDLVLPLDLDRKLNDINRDIILYTIERFGGNLTKAAASLGISRTTLWRFRRNVYDQSSVF